VKYKIIVLLLLYVCLSIHIYSQNTSITFRSNSEITVRINKPIDNVYNFYAVTDRIDLKPNINIDYKLDIHNFCSVKCQYSNGYFFSVLLQEGDHLEIDNINNKIFFKGDNAAGNQYLVDNYCYKGLGTYYPLVESIFKKYITNKINFEGIDKEFQDSIIPTYSTDLEKMKNEGKITSRFANLLSKNLNLAYIGIIIKHYMQVYKAKFQNYKPTNSDSIQIIKKIDELYFQSLTNDNILKFNFFPFQEYYPFKYKTLDSESKKKLLGKYDTETFGIYAGYLQAPDNFKPILFGKNFVSNLQNMYTEYFDNDKLLKYLTENFPNSEYLPIITKMLEEQNRKVFEKTDQLKIKILDGKKINTLKELSQIEGIKGKWIYIDLWSVYCMPCKLQFEYNNDLHKLLNKYENLVSVYITLDDETELANWKNQIEHYHLSGYHLMASKALYNDLSNTLYNKQSCYIPRYILINENGKIINDNLPRPETFEKLKEELRKDLGY